VQVIPTGGQGAGRIAVSPDGRYAASTHGGTQDVAIIDTDKRTVVATVPLGRGPGFPLFSPDSSKLYVMNSGSGDVAVIDVVTRALTARHKVGTDPFGGAVKTR
jgi:YVTN family beta-propeller protein